MKLSFCVNQNQQITFKFLVLFIILSCAFYLRIYKLEYYPSQIHVDELSNIYDGFSLAETGADRSGMQLPVIIRGFGDNDYRPPLYVWLSSISIKILGYSIFSGRLPSLIFGMFSLLLLFFTARKIGGEIFAYLSLLLAAISPWHITYSRIALESAVLPSFFIILTIYLFVTARESCFKLSIIAMLGFCIGFATNDYQSTKLIFFIISILVLLYITRYAAQKVLVASVFIVATAIGASPQLYAMFFMPEHFFSRAGNTMVPFKPHFDYFVEVLSNFHKNLSPGFLFLNMGTYNNLTVARLLTAEMSFFYFGIFALYWRFNALNKISPVYIYFLIVLSILPSALTYDNPHALRASGNIILFPMVTASGILAICKLISNKVIKKTMLVSIVASIIVNFSLTVSKYINSPEMPSVGQQNLLVEMGIKIAKHQHLFDKILIEDFGNQPYIYIVNYCNIHPFAFQKMHKVNVGVGWDHFTHIGKFHFQDFESILRLLSKNENKFLVVVRSKIPNHTLIDSVEVHGEGLFLYKN